MLRLAHGTKTFYIMPFTFSYYFRINNILKVMVPYVEQRYQPSYC